MLTKVQALIKAPFRRLRTSLRETSQMVKRLGLTSGVTSKFRSIVMERFADRGRIYRMPWPGLASGVALRAGTSDVHVYKQMILRSELEFQPDVEPSTVLDGGANIGLSTVTFALAFPDAFIVCVEPDGNNVRVLQENIRPFRNRTLVVQGAIWKCAGRLRIDNPTSDPWAFQVVEDRDGPIEALTVPDLVLRGGLPGGFDLVKLDIEGAEREVFSGDIAWTVQTTTIAVELHDWLIPGCELPVLRALPASRWSVRKVGEYSIFSKRPDNESAVPYVPS